MARILILNSYHGGSHQAVVEGWMRHSEHEFKLLGLPPHHWKWRMRHAALSFAEEATSLDQDYDLVWCTDMLDVAAWRGLAPRHLSQLPHLLYMHENQLLYPDQHKQKRDYHFAFTNYSSCRAADLIAWNSAWHRDQFIADMKSYMRQMPDYPCDAEILRDKSIVLYPGFDAAASNTLRLKRGENKVPHVVWAARWHWEKGPDIFFNALALLGEDIPFTLSVIGGDPIKADELFQRAEQTWQHRIKQWGYVPSKDYWPLLHSADIVVSTARHEFFGLAMVEASAAGCRPILPRQLSYPEVFAQTKAAMFYQQTAPDSGAVQLADALTQACATWQDHERQEMAATMDVYRWDQLIEAWDAAVNDMLA